MSSNEQIDTSDDLMDVDINQQFIADCAAAAAIKTKPGGGQSSQDENEECDQPRNDCRREEVTLEVEAAKARMFTTPGKNQPINSMFEYDKAQISPPTIQKYSSLVDENYLVVGSHLDGGLQNKILNNEYVDFARLIP